MLFLGIGAKKTIYTGQKHALIQLYMAMDVIPYYLKEIKLGQSTAQNINAICFAQNGLIRN